MSKQWKDVRRSVSYGVCTELKCDGCGKTADNPLSEKWEYQGVGKCGGIVEQFWGEGIDSKILPLDLCDKCIDLVFDFVRTIQKVE